MEFLAGDFLSLKFVPSSQLQCKDPVCWDNVNACEHVGEWILLPLGKKRPSGKVTGELSSRLIDGTGG